MKKLLISTLILYTILSAKSISIIGTADLQGALEPTMQKVDLNNSGKKQKLKLGGISHLATLFKELKEQNPNSVIVSAGDDLMGKYFHIFKGKAILGLMSNAGYEIFAPGNHEFDKGSKTLASALQETKFTTLCSDLNVSKSALNGKCTSFTIKDFSGTKVGFFSLITESLLETNSDKSISFYDKNVPIAKKMVKQLKDKGADVIVLISHIGYKQDAKLAKQVKGIDLIFGGHSHSYVKKIGHIGKTAIVNGGEQGAFVIKADIPIKDGKVLHKQITMSKIAVTQKYSANKEVEKKLAEYKAKLPKTVVLGKTNKEWILNSKVNRRGESTVANMVDDLLRDKYKVDIVLNNAGTFRGKKVYPKGNVTNAMLHEIDEFGSYAFTLKIKGKYLKEILEHSAANYGKGGLMQVSGLKYTIDLKKPMQKIENEKITQKGQRVVESKVLQNSKWIDIEPAKEYTMLTNAYIVQNSGDGYYWFKKYGKNLHNTYDTLASIMAQELNKKGVLSPKERDGRLIILK